MRLKYLYTILLLCCVNICFAQNKLFDKYADMDDVTSVYISKKMFQMMPVMETAGRQATRRTDTGVDHDSRHGRRGLQRHAIVRAFYAPRCAGNYQ